MRAMGTETAAHHMPEHVNKHSAYLFRHETANAWGTQMCGSTVFDYACTDKHI